MATDYAFWFNILLRSLLQGFYTVISFLCYVLWEFWNCPLSVCTSHLVHYTTPPRVTAKNYCDLPSTESTLSKPKLAIQPVIFLICYLQGAKLPSVNSAVNEHTHLTFDLTLTFDRSQFRATESIQFSVKWLDVHHLSVSYSSGSLKTLLGFSFLFRPVCNWIIVVFIFLTSTCMLKSSFQRYTNMHVMK